MNSCPSPEMIAVRTGPSAPRSSAMPDELQRRRGDRRRRRFGERRRGAVRRRRAGARARGAEREQIAARLRRRRGRARAARAAARSRGELRAALFDRRSCSTTAAADRVIRRRGAGEPRDERRRHDHDRRRPLQVHRDLRAIVARALSRLCYYSSCTLHRLVLRSIPLLRSHIVAVIPARFASTRFPGKAARRHRRPADDRARLPARRRRRRSCRASSSRPTICGSRRASHGFGGKVRLTRADHQTGTDRLAEVAATLDCDIVVNVQGDEPLIDPRAIDEAVAPFVAIRRSQMTTLYRRIDDPAELTNPNVVKVVVDRGGFALYFSRAPIPLRARSARRLAAALSAYRPLRVSPQRAAGAGVARADAARAGRSRSNSCARSSTASASRRSKPRTTRSAWTRRRIWSRCAACWRRPTSQLSDRMTQTTVTGRPTKYIFVTGGVVSSLGKGLAAASIGCLLEGHGYKVTLQKFDPYINVDPGHDEPVPARRGLRHRRRRRDRPRPRATTSASPTRSTTQQLELDDRQDLPERHPEGAARRLPRPHRAGDSAHHQRDQGRDPRRSRRTSTSCWSRSAARSATSRACRSSKRSASSARTSAATTRSTST